MLLAAAACSCAAQAAAASAAPWTVSRWISASRSCASRVPFWAATASKVVCAEARCSLAATSASAAACASLSRSAEGGAGGPVGGGLLSLHLLELRQRLGPLLAEYLQGGGLLQDLGRA